MVGSSMENINWELISSSTSGSFMTYYARLNKGFLIKTVELMPSSQLKEETRFFATFMDKDACEWDFEEL